MRKIPDNNKVNSLIAIKIISGNSTQVNSGNIHSFSTPHNRVANTRAKITLMLNTSKYIKARIPPVNTGQRKYITMSRRRPEKDKKKQAEENRSPTYQKHKKIRTPKVRYITLRETASES